MGQLKLKLTDRAIAQIEDLHDRIKESNPTRADSFIQELLDKMDLATLLPQAWTQIAGGSTSERYISHGDYIITYEITAQSVIVRRVFHAALDMTNPELH